MMRTFKCGHGHGPANTNSRRQCKACPRARSRRWNATNKERQATTNRTWRETNKERNAARQKVWYDANREHRKAANKAWQASNPERYKQIRQGITARHRAAGSLTVEQWRSVLYRYGSLCLACGSDAPPTIDHIVPRSKGGLTDVDNVQPLCGPCNSRKGVETIDYRQRAS